MLRSTFVNHNETRQHLISAALDFAAAVSSIQGIERVALIGSICKPKPAPKDVDILVTIAPSVEMQRLATLGRRLKGTTQQIDCGADIFLADLDGGYLGRTCHWKTCEPGIRMACEALNCGQVQYLYDDLQHIELGRYLIANPAVIIYPELTIRDKIPRDLMDELKSRFEKKPQ